MSDRAEDEANTAILDLLAKRKPGKTICPSEAARALAGERGRPDDWRDDMAAAHEAARRLAEKGRVRLTQRGEKVTKPVGAYRIKAR